MTPEAHKSRIADLFRARKFYSSACSKKRPAASNMARVRALIRWHIKMLRSKER